jgi:nucleoside-diphosphate-sugar epimerase
MPGKKNTRENYAILLTGGSGFLGRAIVRELLKEPAPIPFKELRILDLQKDDSFEDERIHYIQGDVRDEKIVGAVTRGMDLVIHAAAIVDWGTKSKEDVISVNFGGTKNLLASARTNRVKAFVFTSSLDVLFDGKPKRNVNEDHPYPVKHSNAYCRSKYLAEKEVMEANTQEFRTAVLRPSDIYGEGDPYHIGSLVEMAKKGFYVTLGNGTAKSQHVYVGNIAFAHLQLSSALLNDNKAVPGNCYFITDGPGTNFFAFFGAIVRASGYRIRPANLWIPRHIAYAMGTLSEGVARLVRPIKYYNPKMSRFAVKYTCTDYTFSSDKARRDFGFTPVYSEEKALERTVAYWKNDKS